ncbi:hypothetical protein VP01_2733g1 [Puccinia sorghi]|uniref:Uncharacterized protein n=1 Tax=Puccinia sorghi TaxID=27349 RepID=A0A0L6V398_9BASI|nr:hypothetical protein VP01_2733g1 [Puccinia sorghi]
MSSSDTLQFSVESPLPSAEQMVPAPIWRSPNQNLYQIQLFYHHVNYGLTLFKDFQTQVADACNKAFTNNGPIILKSIAFANPTIEWLATISRTPRFLKRTNSNSCPEHTTNLGSIWQLALKRAAKEDLVAAHVAHEVAKKEASRKQKALGLKGNEDSDNNDKEDLDAGAKKVRIEAESFNSTSTPDFEKLGPSVTSFTQDQLALIAGLGAKASNQNICDHFPT